MDQQRAQAIEMTISMLGNELRKEHDADGNRRADVLRGRLRNADQTGLTSRFLKTHLTARVEPFQPPQH